MGSYCDWGIFEILGFWRLIFMIRKFLVENVVKKLELVVKMIDVSGG